MQKKRQKSNRDERFLNRVCTVVILGHPCGLFYGEFLFYLPASGSTYWMLIHIRIYTLNAYTYPDLHIECLSISRFIHWMLFHIRIYTFNAYPYPDLHIECWSISGSTCIECLSIFGFIHWMLILIRIYTLNAHPYPDLHIECLSLSSYTLNAYPYPDLCIHWMLIRIRNIAFKCGGFNISRWKYR